MDVFVVGMSVATPILEAIMPLIAAITAASGSLSSLLCPARSRNLVLAKTLLLLRTIQKSWICSLMYLLFDSTEHAFSSAIYSYSKATHAFHEGGKDIHLTGFLFHIFSVYLLDWLKLMKTLRNIQKHTKRLILRDPRQFLCGGKNRLAIALLVCPEVFGRFSPLAATPEQRCCRSAQQDSAAGIFGALIF